MATIALGIWANVATVLYARATVSRQLDDLGLASSSLDTISKTVDNIEDRDMTNLKDLIQAIRGDVRSVGLYTCTQAADHDALTLKECGDQFLDHPLPLPNLKPN